MSRAPHRSTCQSQHVSPGCIGCLAFDKRLFLDFFLCIIISKAFTSDGCPRTLCGSMLLLTCLLQEDIAGHRRQQQREGDAVLGQPQAAPDGS